MKRFALFAFLLLAGCSDGTTTSDYLTTTLTMISTTCSFLADSGPIIVLLGQPGATAASVASAVCAGFNAIQQQNALVSTGNVTFDVNGVTVTGKKGK